MACCIPTPDYGVQQRRIILSGDVEVNPGPVHGSCSACGQTIRAGSIPLQCTGQCGRVSHKQTKCSGLSRASQAQGSWTCSHCRDGQPSGNVLSTPSRPTAAVVTVTGKCAGCCKRLAKNPMSCSGCKRYFHQSCTGNTRGAVTNWQTIVGSWRCSDCTSTKQDIPTVDKPNRSEGKSSFAPRRQISCIQWNADGLSTGAAELSQLLKERPVDLVMIQESKLRTSSKIPQFPGYVAEHRHRPGGGLGGGLVTYIKSDVPYTRSEAYRDEGNYSGRMEALSISVKDKGGERYKFVNVYSPPTRVSGQHSAEGMDQLICSKHTLFAGDLNCHSKLWDSVQPEDDGGSALEDWLAHEEFGCANDGSHSRVNPGTGGKSTPDVTLVHNSLLGHVEWECLEGIGSDHRPILFTVGKDLECLRSAKRPLRWKWSSANWSNYRQSVDDRLAEVRDAWDDWSLREKVEYLSEAMVRAAKASIAMVRGKDQLQLWMTTEIKDAIRLRNQLGRDLAANRDAWKIQCAEVKRLIGAAKEKYWRSFVERLSEDPGSVKSWKVIRNLAGRSPASNCNKALTQGEKEIRSNRAKADAFAKSYANISRHKLSKEERKKERDVKISLTEASRVLGPKTEEESEFTVAELDGALNETKSSSAPGADGIHPRFLQELGAHGRLALLDCFNLSWSMGELPQSWRRATIVPILKSGKPADKMDSYRPISLTSCMGKVMERMVGNRLTYLAEKRGMWCNDQSGFRRHRTTEDQTLRITQNVSDGFQARPGKRSVLALLDFSKAYDTVWRADLLGALLTAGVPVRYILWIRGLLTGRVARVRFNGEEGKSVLMRQGVPQGSVLSPLLFLFVIDRLRDVLSPNLTVSLFADDVAIMSSSVDRDEAVREVESGVTAVSEWSKKHKLILNPSKCEIGFFSNAAKDSTFKPEIRLDGRILTVNPEPVFLGVTYDRSLTFAPHVSKVAARVVTGCRVLGALSGHEWGWKRRQLRTVYLATSHSRMKYCAASWMPWAADSTLQRLEVAQNRCLRVITGQHSSTPTDSLRIETGIPSVRTLRDRSAAEAMERSLRLPQSNPRKAVAERHVRHRLVRSSWRREASKVCEKVGLTNLPRQPLAEAMAPPWRWQVCCWSVNTSLIDGSARTAPADVRYSDAKWTIRSLGRCDFTIYTDGSAEGGIQRGGSAAVVTTGDVEAPVPVAYRRLGGSNWTSSFDMEMRALELAADYLSEFLAGGRAVVCSDSLSALSALKEGSHLSTTTARLRHRMRSVTGEVVFQWVPGHCGLPGNEMADQEARAAAIDPNFSRGSVPVSFASAKSVIRREVRDPRTDHQLLQRVYSRAPRTADVNRKTDVILAQLRSGHSRLLASYRHRIGNQDTSTCSRCELEDEDLEHFLCSCPASVQARLIFFGSAQPSLEVLTNN